MIKIGDKVKVINPKTHKVVLKGFVEQIRKGKAVKVRYVHPSGDKWEILNTSGLIVKRVKSLSEIVLIKSLPKLLKRLK